MLEYGTGVEEKIFHVLQGRIFLHALESFIAILIEVIFAYADFCIVGSTD